MDFQSHIIVTSQSKQLWVMAAPPVAGTIGACLLTTVYGIHSEEALKRVQKAFNTRGERPGNSPETEGQRNFVRNYVH